METSTKATVALAALAVLGVVAVYVGRKLAQGVAKIPDALNPASDRNIVYTGVGKVVNLVSPGDSLGTLLAGVFDPASRAAAAAARALKDPYEAGGYGGLTAADQADLDQGAAMRAMAWGVDYVSAADVEDFELGRAMRAQSQSAWLDYSHLNPRR